jgi:hypothetical protein
VGIRSDSPYFWSLPRLPIITLIFILRYYRLVLILSQGPRENRKTFRKDLEKIGKVSDVRKPGDSQFEANPQVYALLEDIPLGIVRMLMSLPASQMIDKMSLWVWVLGDESDLHLSSLKALQDEWKLCFRRTEKPGHFIQKLSSWPWLTDGVDYPEWIDM